MSTRRYTRRGGPEVEARVAAIVDEATAALRAAIPSSLHRAVLLVGGYGRGEGGVEVVDGVERPANNLDILIVASRLGALVKGPLKRLAEEALRPVAERGRIGIDVGVVARSVIERAPCRVFWYDMRFGHRTLLGDPGWAPSLDRFTAEAIQPSDARDLLVNRVTLLVINDAILELGVPAPDIRRQVIRHGLKAVIGAGDALLFFLGGYHWSYAERQRRMRSWPGVPRDLAALYDEAMEERFHSDLAAWDGRDLAACNARWKAAAEAAHLEVESRRLGEAGLGWHRYPDLALASCASEALRGGPGRWVRAVAGLRHAAAFPARAPFVTMAGWFLAAPRDRMALALPAAAYGVHDPHLRAIARAAIGARDDSPASLRDAYLRAFGRHGDPNFAAAARRLGIAPGAGGAGP